MAERFRRPGDLTGEHAEMLPGDFGQDEPDASPTDMVDAVFNTDLVEPNGETIAPLDADGTGFASGLNDDTTYDPGELELGAESGPDELGGAPSEPEQPQQQRDRSV